MSLLSSCGVSFLSFCDDGGAKGGGGEDVTVVGGVDGGVNVAGCGGGLNAAGGAPKPVAGIKGVLGGVAGVCGERPVVCAGGTGAAGVVGVGDMLDK